MRESAMNGAVVLRFRKLEVRILLLEDRVGGLTTVCIGAPGSVKSISELRFS